MRTNPEGHQSHESQHPLASLDGSGAGHSRSESQSISAHPASNQSPGVQAAHDSHGTTGAQEEAAGQPRHESQLRIARSLPEICDELANHQARRRFSIGQQSRQNNALGALARWQLGWHVGLKEAERERIRKDAAKLLKSIQDGKAPPEGMEGAAAILAPYVQDTAVGLAPHDLRRAEVEKEMKKLAKLTPGYAFAKDVKGFGDLGLAVVIGEAGNLANYPHWRHLWKRLGWAPREEYPKGEKSEGRKVPRRVKGELYGTVVESMMKHQLRSVKGEDGKPLKDDAGNTQSEAIGPYGEIYLAYKKAYLARFLADGSKSPKMHAHKLAMRVMIKAALKDLWKAWNGHQYPESHRGSA